MLLKNQDAFSIFILYYQQDMEIFALLLPYYCLISFVDFQQ